MSSRFLGGSKKCHALSAARGSYLRYSRHSKHRHLHMESSLYQKLNSVWHKRALNLFMLIVLAHWAEHLAQAYQIHVLGWTRPQSNGVLGLFFPWLVSSEVLHYGYAIVMLIGIWMLRAGFTGTSRKWWTIALVIQFWHHIEHALPQWQGAPP